MLRRVSDADYGLIRACHIRPATRHWHADRTDLLPMAVMAAKKEASDRLGMAVDLLRRQYVVWLPSVPVSLLVCATFCWQGHSYAGTAGIIVTCVALLTVAREHLRQMLLLYTMPGLLLTTDAVYAVVLLGGTYAATRSRLPVHLALLGVGTATLLSTLTSMSLFRQAVGWGARSYKGALREVWRLGKWGLAGTVLTWVHWQGFFYLLAALEGANMVAGVAAARLLLMPINLLLTGASQLLLPMASRWQNRNGTSVVVRKNDSHRRADLRRRTLLFQRHLDVPHVDRCERSPPTGDLVGSASVDVGSGISCRNLAVARNGCTASAGTIRFCRVRRVRLGLFFVDSVLVGH